MATPVITDKWAGNFDCSICRRKRLLGSEFSKKALERFRKSGGPLKCKTCTAAQEEKEREIAARKIKLETPSIPKDLVICASCKKSLDPSRFNRNQLSKKEKARCRECVENAIREEEESRKSCADEKLSSLRSNIEKMKVSGDIAGLVQAESELSAMEAEMVTGLKPRVLGRGVRGRYRARGRGSL